MSSRNRNHDIDGIPFPYQPSPPASKHPPRITAEEHKGGDTPPRPPGITESDIARITITAEELTAEITPSPPPCMPDSGELLTTGEIYTGSSGAAASPLRPADYTFYANDESQNTIVQRGGFSASKRSQGTSSNTMRCYPPLPNSAYGLTSQAHIPQDADVNFRVYTPTSMEDDSEDCMTAKGAADSHSMRFPSVIGSNVVNDLDGSINDELEVNTTTIPKEDPEKKYQSINDLVYNPPRRQPLTLTIRTRAKDPNKADQILPVSGLQKTRGEVLAASINFNRATWIMNSPGISGDIYPAKEQRSDYINYVDKEEPVLEFCKVCKIRHIPPGPPITLEDRDTCGAYLPDWFPINEFERPWFSFNKLINEEVKLEEMLQGYGHKPNPDHPFWDLQFHEYSSKWRAIGKRGGWWKCRDGDDATDAERECDVCHDERAENARAEDAARKGNSVAKRVASIKEFIAGRMKEVGERDKAFAIAQIRAEGYPEYIGPRKVEDKKFRNPVLCRTASMSTMRSQYSVDGDATPSGWGTPVRGCSPPRGRSPVRTPSRDRSPVRRQRE